MSLDALHPSVVHHIVNTLGWPDLRPLQRAAVMPLTDGEDALLLAPTAGGKTEAAVFPLLSRMLTENWSGLSMLYICPIKALLNNLAPRLEAYGGWLGRRVGTWHGDVSASVKERIRYDPPDILLTTPESLEGLLVSTKTDHGKLFEGLRAVVIDEVHAFAGDDRGWHLRAVLERLAGVAGRPLQRVGCSATVGNPDELLEWLQGSQAGHRPGRVIAPDVTVGAGPAGDVELDHVGSVENAAKVIAALHHGEKRLVFADSRRLVEELGTALRARNVTTFLSHASLSVDERRQAEAAFASSRDCVIVATSTLELGLDVGDLDRVIQLNAPRTVASFLQRIGRTGRRADTVRNCLFLALDEQGLLDAAGLLTLWGRGWVEPVVAPPEPAHIVAQQVLALCLQDGRIGDETWHQAWHGLHPFDRTAQPILDHLITEGFLDHDQGMLHIGPAAEKRFGMRHFLDLTSVFTAAPEFTALNGRTEIGRIDPAVLAEPGDGPRAILLAGRAWRITGIDWKRRRVHLEPSTEGGRIRWNSIDSSGGRSFALTRATRDVMLGEDPPVRLTRRAVAALADARAKHDGHVSRDGLVVERSPQEARWWTWAGYRANLTIRAGLAHFVDDTGVTDNWLRLRPETTIADLRGIAADSLVPPEPDDRAVRGLKFSTALPVDIAKTTLAARLADLPSAAQVITEPLVLRADR
ncbi:ATP-dependent Lhr-like helicase [Stackebrandtia albiflava]|uniref:ATP-dependent Lhr-like helicase n=1 Tax=Stackebrandtia albiflava TaxID=406432 RepID=A0A562URG4_9ACTN|nr:DEAD/DEAH box helicase [Stackebrandtia albiflava]TWJ08203.1 ATP-dependent Lhr-like helicase [Stackebrandtia albiflava]